jgi:hypothetical protein
MKIKILLSFSKSKVLKTPHQFSSLIVVEPKDFVALLSLF